MTPASSLLVPRRQIVNEPTDTAGGGADRRAFLASRDRADRRPSSGAATDLAFLVARIFWAFSGLL